jgi:hypothetical protein
MSILLALTLGCAMGPYGAPVGAEIVYLTGSDETGPIFDLAYNDPDDGVGLLLREQVMVTIEDTEQGRTMPLNNILVELTSGWSEAYIIPATAVTTVTEYEEACETDGSEECAAWFDIGEDRYVEFGGDYTDLGGLRPTYYRGGTDNRGILDFYVFIDSIPVDDEGEVFPIPIFASIGVAADSWTYDFQ